VITKNCPSLPEDAGASIQTAPRFYLIILFIILLFVNSVWCIFS